MVIAKRKDLAEIQDSISGYKRILNVGCAGCTAVCLAGGQKEVDALNLELAGLFKESGETIQIEGYTVERQCEMEFNKELDPMVDRFDALLSMACGAGVQFIAERFPKKPVFPAVNTTFIGNSRGVGWFEEMCRSCRDCQLAYTGGICPVTKCAKSLFNGPCGGTNKGKCEVDKDISCAWNDIYERLKAQNRLDNILKIRAHMKWQNQIQGTVIQDAYKDRYVK
jgi:hypothetical protein